MKTPVLTFEMEMVEAVVASMLREMIPLQTKGRAMKDSLNFETIASVLLKTAATATFALTILPAAGAEGGQIYPDAFPRGDVIELQSRDLTINSLSSVIEICTGETTLDVARQIFPAVSPQSFNYKRALANFTDGGYFFRQVSGLQLPVMDTYIISNNASYLGVYQNAEDDSLNGRDKINGYLVVLPNPLIVSSAKNRLRAIWPQLEFDKVERAAGYDDFGTPINPRFYAENLRIVKPAEFAPVVRFENVSSGVATRFTADSGAYVDCLMREINR